VLLPKSYCLDRFDRIVKQFTLLGLVFVLLADPLFGQVGANMPSWPRFSEGTLAGFFRSPNEHIINDVPPTTVSRIKGVVHSEAGPWPSAAIVVVEVRGPEPATSIRGIRLKQNGEFDFALLPPGRYLFKATSDGWQSATGTIVVSSTARDIQSIEITLALGV
jgi:hypothetical protein